MRGGSRNIIVPGGSGGAGGAPTDATYIVQTAHGDLTDEQALSALASGVVKNTTGTGVLSVATVDTAEITDDAVTYAKVQNVSATDRLLGRSTAGAGNIEEITCTAAGRALLDDATAAAQRTTLGVAPVATSYFFGNGLGAGFAPTDNTNHYLGAAANPTNTAPTAANSANAVMARQAGTITDVYFGILVGGTNGSAETGSLMIRVNDTTDNTIFNNTIAWNVGAVFTAHTATGLSVALSAGDFWAVKLDPPTWATNPTAVFYFCQVVVTYP
jgi:hypothetical protein